MVFKGVQAYPLNDGSNFHVCRGGRKEKLKAIEIALYIKKRWPHL
jgi:hypothetical protein